MKEAGHGERHDSLTFYVRMLSDRETSHIKQYIAKLYD